MLLDLDPSTSPIDICIRGDASCTQNYIRSLFPSSRLPAGLLLSCASRSQYLLRRGAVWVRLTEVRSGLPLEIGERYDSIVYCVDPFKVLHAQTSARIQQMVEQDRAAADQAARKRVIALVSAESGDEVPLTSFYLHSANEEAVKELSRSTSLVACFPNVVWTHLEM